MLEVVSNDVGEQIRKDDYSHQPFDSSHYTFLLCLTRPPQTIYRSVSLFFLVLLLFHFTLVRYYDYCPTDYFPLFYFHKAEDIYKIKWYKDIIIYNSTLIL